jgi:transposase
LRMRNVVVGIFYVLATVCQWKAMPKQFGCGSAIHTYLQEWTKLGVFQELARHGLTPRPQIHADMPETFFGQLKVPFTAQRL